MSNGSNRPFCVKGGEIIGNVPTINELAVYIKDYIKNDTYPDGWGTDEVKGATRKVLYDAIESLREAVIGQLEYKGTWDASGGSYPSSPELGWYYVIDVAGEIEEEDFIIGDWIVYNGASWDKVAGERIVNLDQIPTRLHSDMQTILEDQHHSKNHEINGDEHLITNPLDWNKINKTGSNLNQIATRLHNELQTIGADDHHTKYTDDEVVTIVMANISEVYDNDNIKNLNDAERKGYNSPVGFWEKRKEMTFDKSGEVKVYWEMKKSATSNTLSGKVYVNDVAVGVQKDTTSEVYVPFEDVITVSKGDKIQIYCRLSATAAYYWVCNMRLLYGVRYPSENSDPPGD